jgi:tellurite resistance protein
MAEFFPEIEIRAPQAEAIARGLYAVARADGQVHEREAALINEFYASTGVTASALGALERSAPIEPTTLAAALDVPALRLLFVKTALLVAFTDSELGPGEAKVISEFAAALDVSAAEFSTLTTQVKEFLLSQLSHLHNVDATVAIARKLKV